MNNILAGLTLFFVTHIIIWFQVNSQFIWPWAKAHPWILAILGFPISYILIQATKYIVVGFDGALWPGRLIGFGSGMVVMAFCTYYMLGEGITTKTIVSLLLALTLVLIQIFWK
tara:strand:- start:153 stop:494 length:342 start_codon:yes stop_codon:yes gene_type:complete